MFARTKRAPSSTWRSAAGAAIVIALAGAQIACASDEIPGRDSLHPVAILGATIHTVSGPAIENGTLVFHEGKILHVGRDVKLPKDVERIDATGRHVYPGLIDSYSNMGLVEINAVRATRDYQETGEVNPNAKANVAVNPDSEMIPVTRSNGVLLSLAVPDGSLVSGQSAMLQLDGWTWEEMTLKSPVGMHISWPAMMPVTAWWQEQSAGEQKDARERQLRLLEKTFADARAYQKSRAAAEGQQRYDSRWEAMLPVLEQQLPIIVAADGIQQIQAAVAFANRQKLKLILYGGWDAPRCAELLKKHDVPVIVSAVYRLPRRRWEDYDSAYTLPQRLRRAGITYCISGSGRFGASNVRNLPYHAATAAAYGLPRDEALKAITLYPARILGVDDRVGSLEAGKDATLFIADGDPLETATQVEAAYIAGRKVDLNDRHKRLWQKYQKRYVQQADGEPRTAERIKNATGE